MNFQLSQKLLKHLFNSGSVGKTNFSYRLIVKSSNWPSKAAWNIRYIFIANLWVMKLNSRWYNEIVLECDYYLPYVRCVLNRKSWFCYISLIERVSVVRPWLDQWTNCSKPWNLNGFRIITHWNNMPCESTPNWLV